MILDMFKVSQYKQELASVKAQNENLKIKNQKNIERLHKQSADTKTQIKQLTSQLVESKAASQQLKDTNTKLLDELDNQKLMNQKLVVMYKQLQTQHLSITQKTALELNTLITSQKTTVLDYKHEIKSLKNEYNQIRTEVLQMRAKLIVLSDIQEMETFGIYHPRYDYATSTIFKEQLTELRKKQKASIKDRTAVNYNQNLHINGDYEKGSKMNDDNIKQLLRAFNTECEAAIYKVTLNNIDASKKRINRSYEELNTLNSINQLSIAHLYLELKLDEMYMAYEYEVKKEEEREVLRQQRELEKEEKARIREIEKQKEKKQRDIDHSLQMEAHMSEKLREIESKFKQQQQKTDETSKLLLAKLQKERDDLLVERDQIIKSTTQYKKEQSALTTENVIATAGYVYIISNIGAFGKDVVKIGVTRRLNPEDRIRELSSASVPYKFDTHALIYSDDAFALEAELHKYFNNKRVNKVNNKKEFFHVTMAEIAKKLKEYNHLTIKLNPNYEAEEYRQTLAIEKGA